MKIPKILFILFSLLGFSSVSFLPRAHSSSLASCPRIDKEYGAVTVTQYLLASTKDCSMSVRLTEMPDKWRSHMFGSTGAYMVFNNFGQGDESSDTGARTYWLYPRSGNPRVVIHPTTVEITAGLASVEFSKETAQIVSSRGADLVEDPQIHKKNRGGVVIRSYSGVYLDSGFTIGHASYEDSMASSMFVDHKGEKCVVKNKDIFRYEYRQSQNGKWYLEEVYSNFDTAPEDGYDIAGDEKLQKFLAAQCPNISFRF